MIAFIRTRSFDSLYINSNGLHFPLQAEFHKEIKWITRWNFWVQTFEYTVIAFRTDIAPIHMGLLRTIKKKPSTFLILHRATKNRYLFMFTSYYVWKKTERSSEASRPGTCIRMGCSVCNKWFIYQTSIHTQSLRIKVNSLIPCGDACVTRDTKT